MLRSFLNFCLILLLAFPVSAQRKQIKIDPDLRANSERMKIKRKGMRAFGRYEFGPYRVIEGKKGWKKLKNKKPLFGRKSEYSSSQKQYFKFVEMEGDTLTGNIELLTSVREVDHESFVFREIFKWHEYEIQEGFTSYNAHFSTKNWEDDWHLIMILPARIESDDLEDERDIIVRDNVTEYRSILTNGKTTITLRRITEYADNEKRSVYELMGSNLTLGYEFLLEGEVVAAVRFIPMNHNYFWVHNKLGKDQKFVLAAATTALCAGFPNTLN